MRGPVAAAVLGVAVATLVSGCGSAPGATPEVGMAVAPQAQESGTTMREKPCPATTDRPFEPRDAVLGDETAQVVFPARVSPGVTGTPSTDAEGKQQVAFDREQAVRPGDRRGNVLLNAHTFPDGSALGNRLLDTLHRGDRIELTNGDQRLCYRVSERVEVDGDEPFPRYYDAEGDPQVAVVVCSGERLGPGVWTKRTVWFASPST